ncbi:hypothetical protein GQ600_22844 [Phytophthora cactorum]|nr:hypothetical protein GQ600_22844 [Phytophthora cactorum]
MQPVTAQAPWLFIRGAVGIAASTAHLFSGAMHDPSSRSDDDVADAAGLRAMAASRASMADGGGDMGGATCTANSSTVGCGFSRNEMFDLPLIVRRL